MTTQIRLANYVSNFQATINAIFAAQTPAVAVYATYNPNYATQPEFIVWFYSSIHQPLYQGVSQTNKGNDQPKFTITVSAQSLARASLLGDLIVQAWHGYTGLFNAMWVDRADVNVLAHDYDEYATLHQLHISVQLYVPALPTYTQNVSAAAAPATSSATLFNKRK